MNLLEAFDELNALMEANINGKSYDVYLDERKHELENMLINTTVHLANSAEGIIKSVEDLDYSSFGSVANLNIICKVDIAGVTKTIVIKGNDILNGKIVISDKNDNFIDITDTIDNILTSLKHWHSDQYSEDNAEWLEKKAKEEEEARRIRQEAKHQANLKELENTKAYEPSTKSSFYEVLGWMAKHVWRISADLPDYEADWFIKRFKVEDKHMPFIKIHNSNYVSPNGWTSQWGLSLNIYFNIKDGSEVPSYLTSNYNVIESSRYKRVIHNVYLVWALLETYGFELGTTQNIEKIREGLSGQNLRSFDRGYNS